MNETLRLIIVEDDDDMFQTYEDAAEEYSSDHLVIETIRKESANEAVNALLSKGFDGAIVDLNLSQSDPSEASGNEVIREILDKHRFPVFVVSGNLHNLDASLRDKNSEFLKFFDRDVQNEKIFSPLLEIFKTGITKILGGRGKIEESLSEIFWTHLAKDFSVWPRDDSGKERTLLRYAISHLAEYLDIPDGDDGFYHEAEVYIKPPIKEFIATGDIIHFKGEGYINLSPPCDIAVRSSTDGSPIINADRIVLAPLIEIDRNSFIKSGLIKESCNSDNRRKTLEEIVKGKRERFSFLPGYGDISPSVVDFQNIQTFTLEEILSANRIATVSGIFLKDIQSRFSAYFGRQGQPDLDKNSLVRKYKKFISPS